MYTHRCKDLDGYNIKEEKRYSEFQKTIKNKRHTRIFRRKVSVKQTKEKTDQESTSGSIL